MHCWLSAQRIVVGLLVGALAVLAPGCRSEGGTDSALAEMAAALDKTQESLNQVEGKPPEVAARLLDGIVDQLQAVLERATKMATDSGSITKGQADKLNAVLVRAREQQAKVKDLQAKVREELAKQQQGGGK